MNMSSIAQKIFLPSSTQLNYKQLYQQSKKNVLIFINHVDNQLSKILKNHELELNELKKQNNRLKQQIHQQSLNIIQNNTNNTYYKSKKNISTNKSYSHQIKQFIDCGISDISLAESKTILTEKRKNSIVSYILQENDENIKGKILQRNERKSLGSNTNKQNQWNEEHSDLIDLKQRMLVCKRSKKNSVSFMNDKQSVKDVLKSLREKASTPINFEEIMRREGENRPKNIIAPDMFKK